MRFAMLLANATDQINSGAKDACKSACNTSTTLQGIFSSVTNAVIFLVGAVSVLMIVIGGLRYVLSSGDPKAAADAKNTILYSVVGVVVAIAAYAIVTFITKTVK